MQRIPYEDQFDDDDLVEYEQTYRIPKRFKKEEKPVKKERRWERERIVDEEDYR